VLSVVWLGGESTVTGAVRSDPTASQFCSAPWLSCTLSNVLARGQAKSIKMKTRTAWIKKWCNFARSVKANCCTTNGRNTPATCTVAGLWHSQCNHRHTNTSFDRRTKPTLRQIFLTLVTQRPLKQTHPTTCYSPQNNYWALLRVTWKPYFFGQLKNRVESF
jgi:hypothetical protein